MFKYDGLFIIMTISKVDTQLNKLYYILINDHMNLTMSCQMENSARFFFYLKYHTFTLQLLEKLLL